MLEAKLSASPHCRRIVARTLRASLVQPAISKGQGSSDLAKIAVGKIAIGLAEMRRVGGVVGL